MNIETDNQSDVLREDEAAKYLAISVSTLKRKRYGNEIGCYLIGTRVRYSRTKHLDVFLQACESTLKGN